VLASQRAGIRCVIVPNQLTRMMRFPQQVKVLESLEEFSLREYLHSSPHR